VVWSAGCSAAAEEGAMQEMTTEVAREVDITRMDFRQLSGLRED
jgi:hypothetical protein